MNPDFLVERARILRTVRAFFDSRGFVETETPVRIPAPAPEPHIDCPASGDRFLRASPELQMKKLLARGFSKIYQIGPCFREGENGDRHSPEFTMLEWYRADAGYAEIAEDASALLREILPNTPERIPVVPVREAYLRFCGWDPFARWDQDRFDEDMALKVEPSLPRGAVFLSGYPAQAASLSRLSPGDPAVAERWELYYDGMELANAFSELVDPSEQRKRFEKAREERRAAGEADYPLDEDFLGILGSVPPSGGAALGIDRLVMAATGARSINDVRAGI